jgi:hypothetical protein
MSDRRGDYRYHPGMQVIAIVLFLVPVAALYLPLAVIPAKEVEARLIMAGLCGALIAMSAPLVWESMMWRLTVTDEGLECRSPWRGSWTIEWDDVKRLEWSQFAMWFIIVTQRGRWFRFTYALGDRDRLLAEFERRLKPEQMARAEAGYLFVGRPFPFRQQRPVVVPRPVAGPAPRRQPMPSVDLSKWGERRR